MTDQEKCLAPKCDLILGDCLTELPKLEANSVDLIITSPPYNLGNYHHTGNFRHNEYDDDIPESDYQKWQIKVLNECYRVLKKDGSLFYNHKNRIKNGIQITPYQWLLKTDFIVKQEIVWITRSQNFDKIRFYPFTERLYWLAKDEKTVLKNTINKYDVFDWNDWKPVGTQGSFKRAFPEKMIQDILSCFPNAKKILDPFAGSGTTCYVAKQMKRDSIGIEINPNHYENMKKRCTVLQEVLTV